MPPMKTPRRITLGTYGARGRLVRVLLSRDEETVIVQHFVSGKRQILRSYPNTRENQRVARTWAKTYAAERDRPKVVKRLTLRELWTLYVAANFDRLAFNSQRLYTDRWRKWELFLGAEYIAEDAGLHDFDKLRKALAIAVNQVRAIVTVVKLVYRWGETRDLINRNRLAAYRFEFGKEEKPQPIAEYTPEEYAKILATLNPVRDWKPWAVLTLLGNQGVRVNAALHLRWEDIGQDGITWPAGTDKSGEQWTQPIREGTRKALEVAFTRKPKAFTPWVFFGRNPNHPYRVQSLWQRLRNAETTAGIIHQPWRAMHGARRMVVGDAFGVTGSLELAGEFVNQQKIETTRGYLRDRGRRQDTASALDRHETVTPTESSTTNELLTVGGISSSARATGRSRTDDHKVVKQDRKPRSPKRHSQAHGPNAQQIPEPRPKRARPTVTRPSPAQRPNVADVPRETSGKSPRAVKPPSGEALRG